MDEELAGATGGIATVCAGISVIAVVSFGESLENIPAADADDIRNEPMPLRCNRLPDRTSRDRTTWP